MNEHSLKVLVSKKDGYLVVIDNRDIIISSFEQYEYPTFFKHFALEYTGTTNKLKFYNLIEK